MECTFCRRIMTLLDLPAAGAAGAGRSAPGVFCQYDGAADRRLCGYECPSCGAVRWDLPCRADGRCLQGGTFCNARPWEGWPPVHPAGEGC